MNAKLKLFLKTNPIITECLYTDAMNGTIILNIEEIRNNFERELSETIELVDQINKSKSKEKYINDIIDKKSNIS